MKKKILWSDFLNPEKKIAINCQTEAEAKELLYMLDARGIEWYGGGTLDEIFFEEYREETSYVFHPNGLRYCSYKYWQTRAYDVYKYGDVEFVDNKEEEATENNEGSDLKKDVLMVVDRLNRLQRDAVMKQNQYRDSFEQWVVFHERESAYRTAAILLERAIKA